MKMNSVRLFLILGLLFFLGGCGAMRGEVKPVPPVRIVAISLFKCNCESVIQETVQDTFIHEFFQETNAKPIKGENGDITIVGTIAMSEGQTGISKGMVLGSASSRTASIGGGSSGSSASGSYATGLTVQAFKNGELIATYSVGQDLSKGKILSPVTLAQNAAARLVKTLTRQNEIGDK
jgi:hypothetical protein